MSQKNEIKLNFELIKKEYVKYLESQIGGTTFFNGITRFISPFLLPDNDCIEIYIKKENEDIIVTDDGELLRWLHSRGIVPKQEEFKRNVEKEGIILENGKLMLKGNWIQIGEILFKIIEAIISLSYTLSTLYGANEQWG